MAAGVGGGTHAFPSIMMCGQDKKVSEAARGGEQRTHHERRFLRHCSAVQQNRRPQTNSAKGGDALARWGAKLPSLILKYLSTTLQLLRSPLLQFSVLLLASREVLWYAVLQSTLLQSAEHTSILLYRTTATQWHKC